MTIKITKTKMIKAIKATKIKEINEINKTKAKIKKDVNSEIQISIIIFIIKRSFAKRVSTRKRRFEVIKNSINMFFIKRLCDIRICEKTFFDLLKCEQCDLNYVII